MGLIEKRNGKKLKTEMRVEACRGRTVEGVFFLLLLGVFLGCEL